MKKQNDIYKKFTCRPQITYFLCSFACMTSLTQSYSLIDQDFATSQVREKLLKTP